MTPRLKLWMISRDVIYSNHQSLDAQLPGADTWHREAVFRKHSLLHLHVMHCKNGNGDRHAGNLRNCRELLGIQHTADNHQSPITNHQSPMSDVRCQMSGVRCQVSGVRCQVSGVRCQVSGVRCQMSDVRCVVYSSFVQI